MKKLHLLRLLLVCIGMAGAFASPVKAAVEININRGNVQPLPIAITDFVSTDGIGAQISAVVEANLKRSGLFAPVSRGAFIETISNPDQPPRFADWTVLKAEALVSGASAVNLMVACELNSGFGTRLPASRWTARSSLPTGATGGAWPTSSPTRSMSG